MLRLLIYFASFLKLLILGKWYPPGHVRDVSAVDFEALVEAVQETQARLRTTELQVEATRKKVYRDDGKKEAEEVIPVVASRPTLEQKFSSLSDGAEVPPDFLT